MTQFQKILEILNNAKVEFILIGGLAAIAQGGTTATSDVDILYLRTPKNISRLVQAFKPFRVRLRGAPVDLPFIFDEKSFSNTFQFTLQTDLGALDLLESIPGFKNFQEALGMSDLMELFGKEYRILSIEGLIRNKKATGRAKDLRALPELEELQKLKS